MLCDEFENYTFKITTSHKGKYIKSMLQKEGP